MQSKQQEMKRVMDRRQRACQIWGSSRGEKWIARAGRRWKADLGPDGGRGWCGGGESGRGLRCEA